MTEVKSLFIPLKTEYYEQFKAGVKPSEMRPYGPGWNERTCFVGRPVTLSKGYGKQNRISGVITRFRRTRPEHLGAAQNDWIAVYGEDNNDVAEIFISTNQSR